MMGATCLFPSAMKRCMSTPTPSKTPSRIPHMMPDPTAVLGPDRIASRLRHEACDDGVPRILLLTDALDGAVERGEHAAPHAEVASEHGCARLDRRERAGQTLTAARLLRAP